jgi:hypothetical protein
MWAGWLFVSIGRWADYPVCLPCFQWARRLLSIGAGAGIK